MKNILIVDDDRLMRVLLAHTLRRLGARIRQAENGAAALVSLAQEPADLLVIDVIMSGLDGLETVQALRADPRHAGLPVIIITSGGRADVRERAAALGVSAFFTKPFSPTELVAKVQELLGGDDRGAPGSAAAPSGTGAPDRPPGLPPGGPGR